MKLSQQQRRRMYSHHDHGGENINTGNAGTVSEASIDVYTYVIIRNASGGTIDQQFTVLYSQSQYTR